MATTLMLIDIQNDYFPGGRMELEGSTEAGLVARHLLTHFRRNHLPVVHIQHIAAHPGATFFLPGTEGAKVHECVHPLEGETIIQKHFPNAFRETGLLEHLHGEKVARLLIAGMMTHMCVDASTRAAADLGFECCIASDACATRRLNREGRSVAAEDVHLAFLAALDGTYGQVLPAQELLARLDA